MSSLAVSWFRRAASRSWFAPPETMTFNGVTYPLSTYPTTTLGFTEERIAPTYTSLAAMAYQANPIVFALMDYRRKTFAQAVFKWQRLRGGVEGQFFGSDALSLLERPWLGASTSDLLSRVITDADLAGNAFVVRRGGQLAVLRPDWMTIVAASQRYPDQGLAAIDARVVGYAYWPGGVNVGEPEILLPEEVCHFAPTQDPFARFRGWPWVNAVVRDVMGDQAATTHKLKFWEQGATPNLVVSLDPAITLEKYQAFVEAMDQKSAGVQNAYRTLYLGGGADVEVVGANLRQVDFKVVQGAGETRIAAAAGVPPILAGLSEGLASATYSNYGQARRSYSDTTLWDLWGNISRSLESIVAPPGGARLWVDGRTIPLLQEDEKDRAAIQQMDASAINTLVTAGYDPETVVDSVVSGDLGRLVWLGLPSVQLQTSGSEPAPEPAVPEEAPAPSPARMLIAQAERELVARGVRPTNENIAEALEVNERTVRRWKMSG